MLGSVDWRRIIARMVAWARALAAWVKNHKGSVIAFLVAEVANFVGLGLLGLLLYYPVAPLLSLHFAPMSRWEGDWVWPTVILAGMGWPFGFLIASVLNRRLAGKSRVPSRFLRGAIYAGVLWAWDLAIWSFFLTFPSN